MFIGITVKEKCLVCGDDSSGFHYGILVCNGCKTFFRRTIMNEHKFVCQRQGNCAVDKSARKTCRHCRFEMCRKAGMDKKLVQASRDVIGVTIRRGRKKNVESTLENPYSPSSGTEIPAESLSTAGSSQTSENEIDRLMRLELLLESHRKMLIDNRRPFEQSIELSDNIPLLTSLDDPPKIAVQSILEDAIQAWRLNAILLLAYVNRMDGFSEIEKEDRMVLVKNFAIKFVTVTCVMRTHKFGNDVDFILSNNISSTVDGPDLFEFASKPFADTGMWTNLRSKVKQELIVPTAELNMTNEEYVLLKAILFWNSDLSGISKATKEKAKAMRDVLLGDLYEHIHIRFSENRAAAQRFGSILILCGNYTSCSLAASESMGLAKFSMCSISISTSWI